MSEKKGSRILYPFKIVGYVCGTKRILLNQLGRNVWLFWSAGEDSFLTVPTGKSFQVYNTEKLQSIMVSPQLSEDIEFGLFCAYEW